jgi:hypothetical protein
MQLQSIKQGDLSVTQLLHKAKVLSDELATTGWFLNLQDFNIYAFKDALNQIFVTFSSHLVMSSFNLFNMRLIIFSNPKFSLWLELI